MKFGKSNYLQLFVASLVTAAILPSANAYSLNSSCNLRQGQSNIQGDANKSKRFPLASVSKLYTAMWAIDTLGINYRYQTKFHVTRVGNDAIDIHIEGSRDPIFGRHAAYYVLSELIKRGYNTQKIETVSFDENFLLGWNLEEKGAADDYVAGDTTYYRTLSEQTTAVKEAIADGIGTPINREKYNELRKDAAKEQIEMAHPDSVKSSIRRVEFKSKSDFNKGPDTTTLTYRSAPLHRIIKNMNNWSVNYIADHLFWNLGGAPAFKTYIQKTMGLGESDINFYIGSGNNAEYIYGGSKVYNEGSCESVVKTIKKIHTQVNAAGMRLTDVMAVAEVDTESTLKNYVGVMSQAVVAKTGTVNVAKTLGGIASTSNGVVYFAILYNGKNLDDSNNAHPQIKKDLIDLIKKNGGPEKLNYTKPIIPLPFDKNSALTEAGPTAGKG